MLSIGKYNLLKEINNIKSIAINNKKKIENLIKKLDINNYITIKLWELEKYYNRLKEHTYTYWLADAGSWKDIYDAKKKYTEEEEISLKLINYKICYLFIYKRDGESIIKYFYTVLNELKDLIKKNHNIKTDVITGNFYINEKGRFIFEYENFSLYNQPVFSINLVLNTEESNSKDINISKELNNKSLIEFEIQIYTEITYFTIENLNLFIKNYIKVPVLNYEGDNITMINLNLNRLNNIGLLTQLYIANVNKMNDMGLSLNIIRRNIYFEKILKNKKSLIIEEYKKIEDKYLETYNNTAIINKFFIEDINEIIKKNSIPNYEIFIDFVEKIFMVLFRASINSFIKELNIELMEKYNILLFIAGGDAMRRYDYNISATKDIDVKLYIGKVKEYKTEIHEIVASHIVKLRNYLEENYKSFLKINTIEINSKGNKIKKELDYSKKSIDFYYNDIKYSVLLRLPEIILRKEQHFRTREIRSSDQLPIDLFSIDFHTIVTINNEYKEDIFIALIDVVIQDEILKDYYYTIENDIPYASLRFLKEDIETTYTTSDRALRRIGVGKYEKDIERYNRIYELINNPEGKLPSISPLLSKESVLSTFNLSSSKSSLKVFSKTLTKTPSLETIDKLRQDVEINIENKELKRYFYIFLYKLENKLEFNIFDIIIVSRLNSIFNDIFKNKYRNVNRLISKIASLKINILNEDLNKQDKKYFSYIENEDNEIIKNYFVLFIILINSNNNRTKISFKNIDIINNMKELLIINDNRKRKREKS